MDENNNDKNNVIDFSIKQALENQYRHIVDATNIVSKTDLQGVITYANSKFVEISGYSLEELIGKPHSIIRHPDVKSSVFRDLWDTIKAKKVWTGTVKNTHKSGSSYIVEASIFPILDVDGEIIEYIAIRHDITELQDLNNKINALHEYDTEQQHIAREKLEMGIVNDFNANECKVLYTHSDILSGDFYSLYKSDDGSRFLYIIDGQGHGISPALTVFAISSTMNKLVKEVSDLQELTNQLFPAVKTFLGEIEQLSYIMIKICPESKVLSYASAGMYPLLMKDKGINIKEVKANNTPFMNFSPSPKVIDIDIQGVESILLYSDGLIEHDLNELKIFSPKNLIIEPLLIDSAKITMSGMKLEDDVTLLYLKI
ncbi:PAS domain S-box protein [Sulfurimonas sp.]|uniref:SpoIIE family protein phosphatase n=1 Tax=Sulfurimonas sp. TaxID=2022749 RepID=UPI0025E3098D|nr:PAS domain S-box protein [Sulfurimonas sp.]